MASRTAVAMGGRVLGGCLTCNVSMGGACQSSTWLSRLKVFQQNIALKQDDRCNSLVSGHNVVADGSLKALLSDQSLLLENGITVP